MLCLLIASALLVSEAYGQAPVISTMLLEGREGDNITFSCDSGIANGGGSLFIFRKELQDEEFTAVLSSQNSRLLTTVDGQSLSVTYVSLTAADNGTMFQCRTSGGASSSTATVVVIFAPDIARLSPLGDPVSVREGQALAVELNVSGNPRPDYKWTSLKNGVQEVVVNDDGITVDLDSITFDPASRDDTGLYMILANNSAGAAELNFTLDVQYPPEFPDEVFFPSDTFNCSSDDGINICASYPGVTVTLLCNASGNPLPLLTRTVAVTDATNIDKMSGREITITSVNSNHAGNYTCTASSSEFPQETKTRVLRLYVGGVAQPLTGIDAEIGQGIVTVSWSYDNSMNAVPAQYFFATVSQMGMPLTNFTLPITTMSLTIPGTLVQEEQTYMASIVVRNLQGDSEPVSESVTIPLGFNSSALATTISYLLSFLTLMTALLL